jgi:AraC family transcriptional regulator
VLPGGLFAVFVHRGPIHRIAETVGAIYREWLPGSGYEHAGVADVEVYDERFSCDSEDSEMEYWISIRPADGPRG